MKTKQKTTFSINLKKIRKEKGLSLLDLANLSGLSKRMLTYYENEATNPPIEKIQILANALSVSINDLIGLQQNESHLHEFSSIDTRTLKKFKQILSLDKNERHFIYKMIDNIMKNKKEKNLSHS